MKELGAEGWTPAEPPVYSTTVNLVEIRETALNYALAALQDRTIRDDSSYFDVEDLIEGAAQVEDYLLEGYSEDD